MRRLTRVMGPRWVGSRKEQLWKEEAASSLSPAHGGRLPRGRASDGCYLQDGVFGPSPSMSQWAWRYKVPLAEKVELCALSTFYKALLQNRETKGWNVALPARHI